MEHFAKIYSGFQTLIILEKICILDVWQGSKYFSGVVYKVSIEILSLCQSTSNIPSEYIFRYIPVG